MLLPLLGLLTLPLPILLPILLPIPLSLPGLKIGANVMVGLGLITPKALRLLSQVSRRCYQGGGDYKCYQPLTYALWYVDTLALL